MATMYFVRQAEVADTFAVAEILLDDQHDPIHKPVGGMIRAAGMHDRPRLHYRSLRKAQPPGT